MTTALVLQALGIVFAVQLAAMFLLVVAATARDRAARRRRDAYRASMDARAARLRQMREATR